ncbi:MAG: phage major capsid protein [Ancalomicrobiaceae bacterium]|nr:phage major capsid protein [Ancalomicrobiaceae bacterium]
MVPAPHRAPEVKSAVYRGNDAGAAYAEFMYQFEAFKADNDRRLAEIERRGSADVVTVDKVDRLEQVMTEQKRQMDELVLKQARPRLSGDAPALRSAAGLEHKAAFEAYMRGGQETNLRRLEEKALSVGSGTDGGYTVPTEVETFIMRRLGQISPIRAIAGNRQVSSPTFQKAYSATGPAGGWVAETTAVNTATASPPLQQLVFPTMELYAMPSATQALLDDSVVDIETWLAGEIDTLFAEQEGAAFVNGDGTNKPKGFLAYTTVSDDSWSWGNLGYVATGAAGAFPASNQSDVLLNLVYTLKAGYRQNATWVMNRKVQSAIRQLKDSQGHYLWQPPVLAGGQASLMNFPLVEAEDMPAIAANSLSIAFGDFQRGYLVVDRIGLRLLRDPYSAKPFVLFYTTKRVGGGMQDFSAIKLLKFAAS